MCNDIFKTQMVKKIKRYSTMCVTANSFKTFWLRKWWTSNGSSSGLWLSICSHMFWGCGVLGIVWTFSVKQRRYPRARSSKRMESEDVYCKCFLKKSKTNHTWQIFQTKANIWNKMWTCEWKVSESIVKGVNKIVNERLQTKWLNGQIQVRMC
jgi:hypothetical protein